ncbi:hypothetical protein [Aeromicrobium sp.]|uniref:hypothetical protein n=1 Tax=Aeromicrobium sp. TaxID=1871063 RepID=UPI0030C0F265
MTTFVLMLSEVRRASDLWDDQAEQLRAGHKRLTDASGSTEGLGDRVGPKAGTYLTTWLSEVTSLATAAQDRADGLDQFTVSTVELDEQSAADLRASLPWTSQDAVVERIGDTNPFPTDDPGPAPPTSPAVP